MTPDSWTWLAGPLVAVGILATTAVMATRMTRTVNTSFYCPWRGRTVSVRYQTCDGEHPIDVVSCTAFADAHGAPCGCQCVSGGDGPDGSGPRRATAGEETSR